MKSSRTNKHMVPLRYVPKQLSRKDRQLQKKMLNFSRKSYKKGKYFTRKKLPSFHSIKSPHILNAEKMYGISSVGATPELARKTKCSVGALKKIVSKGAGAYFSSGSRPNQSAQSWGIARLASAVTGGKAAAIDYHILKEGCQPGSKALRLASRVKRPRKTRRVAL
jgi:hypothetical protein